MRFADDVSARRDRLGGRPGVEVVVRARVPALGLGGPAVELTVRGTRWRSRAVIPPTTPVVAGKPRGRAATRRAGSALVELTWLGLLLLVPLVWIVLSVFEVQRGAFATAGAARAAARAFALAPDDSAAGCRAGQLLRRVLDDQGIDDPKAAIDVTCVPAGDCHSGGTR